MPIRLPAAPVQRSTPQSCFRVSPGWFSEEQSIHMHLLGTSEAACKTHQSLYCPITIPAWPEALHAIRCLSATPACRPGQKGLNCLPAAPAAYVTYDMCLQVMISSHSNRCMVWYQVVLSTCCRMLKHCNDMVVTIALTACCHLTSLVIQVVRKGACDPKYMQRSILHNRKQASWSYLPLKACALHPANNSHMRA